MLAPIAAARSSAPHVIPDSRAIPAPAKSPSRNGAIGVSVATGRIRIEPAAIPFAASSGSSMSDRRWTQAGPSVLGCMIPSGPAGMTAARSSSVSPLSNGLTRTHSCGRRLPRGRSLMNAATSSRARTLLSGETASSRSRITASAPQPSTLPSFFSLSPGMNSKERSGSSVIDRTAGKVERCSTGCSFSSPYRFGRQREIWNRPLAYDRLAIRHLA